MTKFLFKILLAMRWLMLIFCFGLAFALSAFAVLFGLKLWKFFVAIPTIDEFEAVLKILGLIDYTLIAGLVVMVMLSTFSSFIENQDQVGNASWLSSMSFGVLKIKLASTIVAIGAITLLEDLFSVGNLNWSGVVPGIAIEFVLMLVLLVFVAADRYGNKPTH